MRATGSIQYSQRMTFKREMNESRTAARNTFVFTFRAAPPSKET